MFERSVALALSSKGEAVELKDVVSFHNGDRGKNYPNKSEYVVEGVPWLNTGQILPDGSLNATKMNFITREKFQSLGGGRVQQGDLVFCLRGATIGKTAFVAPHTEGAIASSLMIIRPSGKISDRYAFYFLTSDLGKEEIKRFIGGAAQPNLAGESVGRFRVSLPSRQIQDEIVEQLDQIKNACESLATCQAAKLQDLDDLRQSLLQKAFAGELT
ncbi:restriction endonuclease subunit S [Falsihalocynthiibacter sp. CO-5D18]|uniref:restriction endonuclease subunit S n=1 Tax=Falsihalocynthiibacter sp. CO-5D18 TaxID=3240872 RepID=UPI003510AD12